MTELPDAPWAIGKEDLPDAPWLAPEPPSPVLSSGLIGSALDVPILGPAARAIEAGTKAALGPSAEAPERTIGERYQHYMQLLSQPLEQYRSEHPVAAALASLPATAAATGGLGATAAGARLLGMAPAGTGLVGQGVRAALSGAGISAADAQLRGEDPAQAAIAGGVIGAVAPSAARAVGAILSPAAKALVPSLEETATAKTLDYKAVNDLGVSFKPAAVNNMASGILRTLENEGRTADVAAPAFKVLERLESRKTIATINDIDNTRKILGQMATGSVSPDVMTRINAGVARDAIGAIDHALENFHPGDFATGEANYAQAIQHLKNARGNAAVGFQAEALDRARYRAENTAAAANSGMNFENSLRAQLRAILNNPARAAQFPPVIRDEMQKIVRGEGTRNAIRFIGNLLGGGGGLGAVVTAGMGHLAGMGPWAPVAGYALKKAGNVVTGRAVNRLDEMVRAQSPLAQARAAAMPAPSAPNPFLRTTLAAPSYRGGLYFPSGP